MNDYISGYMAGYMAKEANWPLRFGDSSTAISKRFGRPINTKSKLFKDKLKRMQQRRQMAQTGQKDSYGSLAEITEANKKLKKGQTSASAD